jgi:hypothetical protein
LCAASFSSFAFLVAHISVADSGQLSVVLEVGLAMLLNGAVAVGLVVLPIFQALVA